MQAKRKGSFQLFFRMPIKGLRSMGLSPVSPDRSLRVHNADHRRLDHDDRPSEITSLRDETCEARRDDDRVSGRAILIDKCDVGWCCTATLSAECTDRVKAGLAKRRLSCLGRKLMLAGASSRL